MSFSILGKVFGISGRKLFNWYKSVLSHFTDSSVKKALHHYDTVDKDLIDKITKKNKKVLVPIFCIENWGKNMAIDDKNIGGVGYTIISNKDTGKIALMMTSCKSRIICEVLAKVPISIRMKVKTITKDLAENYDWVARTMMMNAQRIADKFHVVVLGMEALQAVRIRFRQEVLMKERKRKQEAKKAGILIKNLPKNTTLSNGETLKQVLAKSRYLLFKFSSDWTESQEERAKILFEKFPEIKIAYEAICGFRNFYKCKVGKRRKARDSLDAWYKKMESIEIDEIQNFVESVRNHEAQILGYFDAGHTNAFAESLNNKIQRFIRSNYGIRDRNFFHFRMLLHFF